MLVSTKWLNEYVDINDIPVEELAERITRAGIEVDAVIDRSHGMTNVVVGYIEECVKHPEADKLSICQVNVGEETTQIICGAPNVAAGQKVIVARPGAVLPGNFKIKKAKLRGEASHGMICSLQELGIDGSVIPKEYADGIYVLSEDAEIGANALELLDLDDTVLEFDLTPNRSDALSMMNIGREVSAIFERPELRNEFSLTYATEKATAHVQVTVEDAGDCPKYEAHVIQNVTIAPSPLWLQNRLMAAGVRPHNNVVDVTNYILLEYGQPLHAFDYDRLGTGEILVRRAKAGEKMVTLDDVERTLQADQLVITNGKEPVALAGVMGAANSEVHEGTTTIVLESAYFDPAIVRRTARKHGLHSDASTRFEKGVDPRRISSAGIKAAYLIQQLAGGEVLEGPVSFDALDESAAHIEISADYVNKRLGMDISIDEMVSILNRLKFDVTQVNDNDLSIYAPTYRPDIKIKEDIIEEIVRLYGYDQIPMTLPVTASTPGGLTPYQQQRRVVKAFLEGAGLYETLTYSLTSEKSAQKYALDTAATTKLLMPISEERSVLRQSILPHLLEVATYNLARRNDSVALYEISSVFLDEGADGLPKEIAHVAAVLTGKWVDHAWQGENKQVDFFVAKGIVEGMMAKLGLSDLLTFEKAALEGMHPGRTANIYYDGERIGFIGQIHPTVQKARDLKDTYVFEMNLDQILAIKLGDIYYRPVPRYPAISRDIALVVSTETTAEQLEQVIRKAGGPLLQQVKLFDLYEGENVEEGKKSIAFSLTYQNPDRTLTDEEVVAAHEQVLAALTSEVGALLRG